jgi:hypothetical protein
MREDLQNRFQQIKVERIVLNLLTNAMRLCHLIFAPSANKASAGYLPVVAR